MCPSATTHLEYIFIYTLHCQHSSKLLSSPFTSDLLEILKHVVRLEGRLDEFPCPYFVSPPYSSSGSIAPRAQVMVPRNIWALSDPSDSFPGRVISSELAGSSSFPRSSLPKAHIPVKTAMGWALAGLFLVPCSSSACQSKGLGFWDRVG